MTPQSVLMQAVLPAISRRVAAFIGIGWLVLMRVVESAEPSLSHIALTDSAWLFEYGMYLFAGYFAGTYAAIGGWRKWAGALIGISLAGVATYDLTTALHVPFAAAGFAGVVAILWRGRLNRIDTIGASFAAAGFVWLALAAFMGGNIRLPEEAIMISLAIAWLR